MNPTKEEEVLIARVNKAKAEFLGCRFISPGVLTDMLRLAPEVKSVVVISNFASLSTAAEALEKFVKMSTRRLEPRTKDFQDLFVRASKTWIYKFPEDAKRWSSSEQDDDANAWLKIAGTRGVLDYFFRFETRLASGCGVGASCASTPTKDIPEELRHTLPLEKEDNKSIVPLGTIDGFRAAAFWKADLPVATLQELEKKFPKEEEKDYRWLLELVKNISCICRGCKKPLEAGKRCTGCLFARYCSRECQKKHWNEGHKQGCGAEKALSSALQTCPNELLQRFTNAM
jgi:hypothetical protein